jgi:hypothetical protein
VARDAYAQREDERAAEDDEYARMRRRERIDRAREHSPAPVECACGGELCPNCGEHVWKDGSCACGVTV